MYRLVCRPPQYDDIETSPNRVLLTAALATMPERSLRRVLSGTTSLVTEHLRRYRIDLDRGIVTRLRTQVKTERYTVDKIRRWSAGYLRSVLSNRLPSSHLEADALVPLVRLAGNLLLPKDLNRVIEPRGVSNYRRGLAQVIRHVAKTIHDSQGAIYPLLAACLLDAPSIDIPPWCRLLFKTLFRFRGPGDMSPDSAPQISGILTSLRSRDFLSDATTKWVDPNSPVSASTFGFWLRQYLELPRWRRPVEDLSLSLQEPVFTLGVWLVVKRIEEFAASLEDFKPYTSCLRTDVVASLLHMLAEVSYHKARLPREFRVARQLESVGRSEVMLYTLGQYRDHLLHVMNVASLGIVLDWLRLLSDSGKRVLVGRRLTDWLLASLWHDSGYTVSAQLKDYPDALTAAHPTLFESLVARLKATISPFLGSVNRTVAQHVRLTTDLRSQFDHGVMSCYFVADMINKVIPRDVKMRKGKAFEHALSAIAKHNLVDETMNFGSEPVAALLVLCDELQDWGRPRWDSDAFASEILHILLFGQRSGHQPSGLCQHLSISVNKSSGAPFRATIVLEYSDPLEEGYDPWALVVCKLRALQRLSGLPRLQLVLRIPIRTKWGEVVIPEDVASFRAVLRRFVRDRDHPVLRPEVLWPSGRNKPAVRWEAAEDYEEVIVDLARVSEFRPVRTSPKDFFPEFAKFFPQLLASKGLRFPSIETGR
jgi:hypothetical protein